MAVNVKQKSTEFRLEISMERRGGGALCASTGFNVVMRFNIRGIHQTQINMGDKMTMQDQSAAMWQDFVKDLAGGVNGLDPKTFLPTSGQNPADWEVLNTDGLATNADGTPGNIIPQNLVGWGNNMPDWAATYSPGNQLFQEYSAFLHAIKLKGGDPAQQQIATIYGDQLTTATTKQGTDQIAMYKAWAEVDAAQQSIPPVAQQTYIQWANSSGWAATLASDQANVDAANMKYLKALQKVGGPDYQTLSGALTDATLSPNSGNALIGPGGNQLPRYDIGAAGSLNSWFLSVLATDGKPPAINFTIDLSQSKESSANRSSYFNSSVSGGYSGFFWGGGGSASYSQSSNATSYSNLIQNLKMTYTAQAANMFTVTPGSWFNSAIVSGFYDQIDPASALANKTMFGENGFLNLETRQIFVVFRPTVTLSGTSSEIDQVTNAFDQQSSASISLGGFFWSGSANVSQGQSQYAATTTRSADGNSVTMKYNTNAPRVLGVIPQNFSPNG